MVYIYITCRSYCRGRDLDSYSLPWLVGSVAQITYFVILLLFRGVQAIELKYEWYYLSLQGKIEIFIINSRYWEIHLLQSAVRQFLAGYSLTHSTIFITSNSFGDLHEVCITSETQPGPFPNGGISVTHLDTPLSGNHQFEKWDGISIKSKLPRMWDDIYFFLGFLGSLVP